MTIKFQCELCHTAYSVPERLSGKQARCKKCGELMQIPDEPVSAAIQATVQPRLVSAEMVETSPTTAPVQPTKQLAIPVSPRKQAPPLVAAELVAAELVEVSEVRIAAATSAASPATVIPPATARPVDVDSISQEELLAAIRGKIKRVPTTFTYRLAATAVACLMVLLPLIYCALIVLAIVGVVAYAQYGLSIFETSTRPAPRGGLGLIIIYVGPLVIGVTTVLFMIKPLFARSARSDRRRSLTRDGEPKLFAFVDQLCSAVHAPRPKRIDVDCDVNASASFRLGLLSLFTRGDLVLTIGMPLAAGLTTRQLAGVLAHEFGHFSQGFGMRVSFVVRSISYWFARVVYERDRWDEWLEKTASNVDFRIGIILHAARMVVWLTRRILWALMMVGHALSSYLLRQMEFDADLHEIRFSGSESFRATAIQLRRLGVAYQQALADQQGFYMDGKLGDDMPGLTQFNRDEQSADLIKKIFTGVMDEKTEWMSTHPVDKDRVARAKAENEAGIFSIDLPAAVLFTHFDAICQGVTSDMFKSFFGEELKPNMLVPVEQLVNRKSAAKEANVTLRRQFGTHFKVPRQLVFATEFLAPEDPQQSLEQLQLARTKMMQMLPDYVAQSKQFDATDSKWLLCHQATALLDMGVKLKQKDFEVPVQSAAAAKQAGDSFRRDLGTMNVALQPLEGAFQTRVQAAMELLLVPSLQAKMAGKAPERFQAAARVCEQLPVIHHAYDDVVTLRNRFASLSLMLNLISGQEVSEPVAAQIMASVEQVAVTLRSFHTHFATLSFPFEHADGQITLTQYMVPKVPVQTEVGEVVAAAQKLLDGYHYIYFRSVGVLAQTVQYVEEALGLPPQVDPPEQEELAMDEES